MICLRRDDVGATGNVGVSTRRKRPATSLRVCALANRASSALATVAVYLACSAVTASLSRLISRVSSVLRDPTVSFAALETARGGLIRFGLGYDWANVGVVTNVAADHLGLRDIETLEDLAKVKSLVVERVFPDGVAVLNAEDQFAPWMAKRTKARVALFSLDPQNELFKAHVAGGGLGAVMDRHDTLCLYRATLRIPLVHARQVPITFDGRARFNIANALAAALAAFAAGIDMEEIRGGLTTFHPSPFQTPGRANVYEFHDFKVMIDYCHNPHAMSMVAPFLASMKRERLVGVINSAGDRREEDFDELGRFAAPHFDYVILRDDEDLRGRPPGEVSELLKKALVKYGMKPENVELVKSESDAVRRALAVAKKGDLVAIFADRIAKVAAQIDFERQKEQRGA